MLEQLSEGHELSSEALHEDAEGIFDVVLVSEEICLAKALLGVEFADEFFVGDDFAALVRVSLAVVADERVRQVAVPPHADLSAPVSGTALRLVMHRIMACRNSVNRKAGDCE